MAETKPPPPTKSPAEVLGAISSISAGMLNPVNLSSKPRPYFDAGDTVLTIAQKLNGMSDVDAYGTLTGIVCSVEEIANESTNFTKFFNLFPDAQKQQQKTQVAFVFIDVIHSSVSYLLNASNYQYYLTKVEVVGDVSLAPSQLIEVSFKSSDYSNGVFVKLVETPTLPQLNAAAILGSLCGAPQVAPRVPAPASKPVLLSNASVGYIQAIYTLAKWQADNPEIQITRVQFPFNNNTGQQSQVNNVASAITALLSTTANINEDYLKKQTSAKDAANRQWITIVTQMLANALFVESQNSAILVSVNASKPIKPFLDNLNNFSKKYNILPNDKESFSMSFPKGTNIPTSEALQLTIKNSQSFLNSIEKIDFSKSVTTNPPAPQPTTQQSNVCAAGAAVSPSQNFTGFPSQLEGIPFVDVGFAKRKKRKQTHLIVMHHSVTSTAAATNRILRSREPKPKGLSVHVGIDRGQRAGIVEQHLPLEIGAAHAGRLNWCSIGVENTNPTGGIFGSYKPDSSKVYEGCYKALVAITKATKIPFRIHEAHVKEGYFYFGKLTNGAESKPGILAHGSDLGTSHGDGQFELLYCHLRHLKMTEQAAYSRAVAMLAEARKLKKHHPPVRFAFMRDGQPVVSGFNYAYVKI